jgi:hypothetical protein
MAFSLIAQPSSSLNMCRKVISGDDTTGAAMVGGEGVSSL